MAIIKPLDGYKIIELSTMITASLSTMMLTEQGASTIKIEPAGIGDTMRYLGAGHKGVSATFINCNRGKQSLALDLKQPQAVHIVKQLVAEADVLVSNYRPGVLERLGLGSESLRTINPQLIYVAVNGYGTEGPLKDAPAYDHVIQAISGISAMQGIGGEKQLVRTAVCDEVTAYTTAQAITAALLQRSKSGHGQHIDISMLESSLYFLWPGAMMKQSFPDNPDQGDAALKYTYQAMPTLDGHISMACYTDPQWAALFKALNRQALAEDPRYSSVAARIDNITALYAEIMPHFAKMSTAEALQLLGDADVPGAECLNCGDVSSHPQVVANNAVQYMDDPYFGNLRVPAHPIRLAAHSTQHKNR